MTDDITNILSKKIDNDLVNSLMNTYQALQKAYFSEDYEGTLSKSGKFVENIFRVLYFIISGKKLTEIKPGEINELSDKLEKANSTKYSDTIRIVIPRVAKSIYTMRSKLGSEHVKPIVPDFIDARFTISSSDWIMAKLLRTYHDSSPSEIDELIHRIKSTEIPKLESFEVQLATQIDSLSIPNLITIILRTSTSLTKSEIIQRISDIGRDVSAWFKGGNLNKRLMKTGIIKKAGKKGNEDLYALTIKGLIHAEKLIDIIKTKKS